MIMGNDSREFVEWLTSPSSLGLNRADYKVNLDGTLAREPRSMCMFTCGRIRSLLQQDRRQVTSGQSSVGERRREINSCTHSTGCTAKTAGIRHDGHGDFAAYSYVLCYTPNAQEDICTSTLKTPPLSTPSLRAHGSAGGG